jgi:hypothetical protein
VLVLGAAITVNRRLRASQADSPSVRSYLPLHPQGHFPQFIAAFVQVASGQSFFSSLLAP